MATDFLEHLNPPQRQAVLHESGPLLILAGAGSGKTRTITHRIAHLVRARGVPPGRVLAVTFTNKAAGEMRERIGRLLGQAVDGLWVSTFHSACVRILRREAAAAGIKPAFTILDEQDRSSLIKACVRELNINESLYPPRAIGPRISDWKNRLIGPDQLANTQSFGLDAKAARVYDMYQRHLSTIQALDFDDLLMTAVRLFESRPDVLAQYQDRFRHILVDEYQDTNHAQYRLVRALAAGHRNLCVVGDDDQSIYRFRGADLSNILSFERDYPEAVVVTLDQNYRSTQQILEAATAVVRNNTARKAKSLWTARSRGERIACVAAPDERMEALFVARSVQHHVGEGGTTSDCVVLYRTNAQSRVFEETFRNGGLPYRIVGGLRFYDRKEIKDVIAYLRLIANPDDDLALKRVINVPARGIGPATLARLEAAHAGSLGRALGDPSCVASLSPAPRGKIEAFAKLLAALREAAGGLPPSEILRRVLEETGYLKELESDKSLETQMRVENLKELVTAVMEYEAETPEPSLTGFLDQVALVTDLEQAGTDGRAVTLMTMHNAKGLEFPVVFVTGMEEGIFPHSRSSDSPQDLEEERRLCYVAITRAMEKLHLSYAESRRIYGSTQWNLPSRFLDEIPEDLLERISLHAPAGRAERTRAASADPAASFALSDPEDDPFPVGKPVSHPTFGLGVVRSFEGEGENRKVTVAFSRVGTKKLSLKYAPLEPAG